MRRGSQGKRTSAKCAPRLFAGNLTSRLVAFRQIGLEPFCLRRTSMKTTGMLTAHADFGKSRTMFAPLHRQGKPPTCKSLGRVNFAARISLLCTSQRANIGELLPKRGSQHAARRDGSLPAPRSIRNPASMQRKMDDQQGQQRFCRSSMQWIPEIVPTCEQAKRWQYGSGDQ